MALGAAALTAGANLIGGLFGASSARSDRRRAERLRATHEHENEMIARRLEGIPETLTVTNTRDYSTGGTNTQTGVTNTVGGSNEVQTEASSSRYNVAAMVAAAEAAGFNPLTFLRNGGLAGFLDTSSRAENNQANFQTTTMENQTAYTSWDRGSDTQTQVRTGHNAALAAQMDSPGYAAGGGIPTAPVPSLGSVIANAASAGIGSYLDDQRRTEDQAFQRQMQDSYLNGVQRQPAPMQRSFYVPSTTTSGPITVGSSGRPTSTLGRPGTPEPGQLSVTNPHMATNVDPNYRDASAWAERYGEPGDWIGGIRNGLADIMQTATGMTGPERFSLTQEFFGGLQERANDFNQSLTRGSASGY